MAITPLKRVADSMRNAGGQLVVTGANWDYNVQAVEDKFNGGIVDADVSETAAIDAGKLAAATVTDREMGVEALRNNLVFWMLR